MAHGRAFAVFAWALAGPAAPERGIKRIKKTHNDLMCHCPVPNCCIDISEVQRFNMTLEPLPAGFEICLTHRTCVSYFHSRELGSNENTTGGAYCHRRISSCIALVCTQQILRIFYRTLGIAVAAGHKNMLRRPSLQADL